ncbi:MAG: ABC transporter ATP-binding protein [Pseudomonadota bacterium]
MAKKSNPQASDWPAMRRLFQDYVLRYKAVVFTAIAGMIIVAVTTALTAYLLGDVVRGLSTQNQAILGPIAIAAVVLQLSKAGGMYVQSFLMSALGQRIVGDLQRDLVHSYYTADLQRLGARHSGEFLAQTMNNVGIVANSTAKALTALMRDAVTVLALFVVMFSQDVILASIAAIAVPIIVLNVRTQTKITKKAVKKQMKEVGTLASLISENLDGTRVVKAYGGEDREIARTHASIERKLAHQFKGVGAKSATVPISEAATGLGLAAIMAYAYFNPSFDLAKFATFIGATMLAYQPMRSVASLVPTFFEGAAAAAKVFEELDDRPQIVDRPGASPLAVTGGAVAFRSVSFSYTEDGKALSEVNFDVPAGRTTALVGPSGAGKSTILNLILRFYDVSDGAVEIDGQDIRAVTMASLRRSIALVTQDPFLFDETVHANIAYGMPDKTRDEVIDAAKAAAAHDFIMAMPNGYDSLVGEGGGRLSGGQRQRIAIARAMLKDAPILLLDEATSALDTQSESLVQEALRTLMKDRTVVVIAHRLSTIADADKIVVFDQGRVVESGTHASLLEGRGLYSRLYASQFSASGQGDGPSHLTLVKS